MTIAVEQVPGFLFVDHVAIAVPLAELDSHVEVYKLMGFTEVGREDVLGSDQVREVLLQVDTGPNAVQLIAPLTPESPIARQLEKNGGRAGFAHLALRVADIQEAFAVLNQRGFHLLDPAPRPGSRGTTVFFVHPRTTPATALGYLLEVVQEGAQGDTHA